MNGITFFGHSFIADRFGRYVAEAGEGEQVVRRDRIRLHVVPTDRVWLRDSAPTGVLSASGDVPLVDWGFNAWAKYDNWALDAGVGRAIARITGLPRVEPHRPDTGDRIVLEGGIETNGNGLLLVTEEWLLTDVQVRNPGFTRADYERTFREWLGIRETIWLGEGCAGDDTHGHIDDIARFVAPDAVVLAPSNRTRATRTMRDPSTTCGDSRRPRPAWARCESCRCRFLVRW